MGGARWWFAVLCVSLGRVRAGTGCGAERNADARGSGLAARAVHGSGRHTHAHHGGFRLHHSRSSARRSTSACWGPDGFQGLDGFRGWSGGNKRTFTLSASDATPSYLPGPIRCGRVEICCWAFPTSATIRVRSSPPPVHFAGRRGPCPEIGAGLVSRRPAHALPPTAMARA